MADLLGADELVDRGIKCTEEDIDLDDQVCPFLTLIGGIIDLAWWDSIGAQTVPTELVLDPVKAQAPSPAPASGG